MRLALSLFLAIGLGGCSTVESDGHPGKVDSKEALKDEAVGIVYSLPMRLAKLTVARKQIPPGLAAQVKAAEAAFTKADEALTQAESTYNRKKDAHDSTEDELKRAKEALEKAKTNKANAETKRDALKTLLGLAKTSEGKEKGRAYTLKLELLADQGDPHQVYVADLSHSPMRDDKITLATTAEGLLTSADVTAADQTSDILVSIAGALAGFGVISPSIATPPAAALQPNMALEAAAPTDKRIPARLPGCSDEDKDITLQLVFDPSNRDDVHRVNRDMLECLVPYKIEVRRFEFATDNDKSDYASEQSDLSPAVVDSSAGLIYRRPMPYLIEISRSHISDDAGTEALVKAACQSAGLRRYEENRHQNDFAAWSRDFGTGEAKKIECSYTLESPLSLKERPAAKSACADMKDEETPEEKKAREDCEKNEATVKDEWEAAIRRAIQEIFEPIKDEYASEQATMASLPNKGPLGLVPFNSSAFVTTDYKAEFENGYPTKWTADRPSEIAAFFRIPVEIAKAILSVPTELIKLRFDLTSESNNLTNATIQQLCLSLQLAAIENASDDDPSNDDAVTVPELCQGAGGN